MNMSHYLKKATPTILTVLGTVGVVTTAIMTARATIKAMELIQKDDSVKQESTKLEIVRSVWKYYIPVTVIGTSTILCIFGANITGKRNQAALTSAYILLSQSYHDYKNKLRELYGDEIHKNVLNAIAKEECKDVYLSATGCFENCDLDFEEHDPEDNRLFYDSFSKRYFESSVNRVLQAEYHLNRNFVLGGCVTANDFYNFLGLEPVGYGDAVGWSIDEEIYWIDFNHHKTILDDGLECLVLDMIFEPYALDSSN